MLRQFGNLTNVYVMVRRLSNKFKVNASCPYVVYWLVNAFVHQSVKDFVTKIHKYVFTDSLGNHLSITYSFGKLAIWQTSFRKKKQNV